MVAAIAKLLSQPLLPPIPRKIPKATPVDPTPSLSAPVKQEDLAPPQAVKQQQGLKRPARRAAAEDSMTEEAEIAQAEARIKGLTQAMEELEKVWGRPPLN